MSLNAIIDAMASKLTEDQTSGSAYDLLGGRIYFGQIPEQVTQLPALRFNVTTNPAVYSLGSRYVEAEIQIDIYTSKQNGDESLATINDKIVTLLDRQSLTISGHSSGQTLAIDTGSIAVEDQDTFGCTSRWRVFAKYTGG